MEIHLGEKFDVETSDYFCPIGHVRRELIVPLVSLLSTVEKYYTPTFSVGRRNIVTHGNVII